MPTYPIKYRSPTLHGDALEHGKHGKTDVVERCNAKIGSLPFLHAQGVVGVTNEAPRNSLRTVVRVAGCRQFTLGKDLICKSAKSRNPLMSISTFQIRVDHNRLD